LADSLVTILEKDPDFKGRVAGILRDLFAPAFLDPYAQRIHDVASGSRDLHVLHLLGVLPSADGEEIKKMAKRIPEEADRELGESIREEKASTTASAQEIEWFEKTRREQREERRRTERLWVDCILARFGDEAATDRLIRRLVKRDFSRVGVDLFANVLSYVSTPRMKKALLEGIDSDAEIDVLLGTDWRVRMRDYCASALAVMMRDEPGLPMMQVNSDNRYSDDLLEQLKEFVKKDLQKTDNRQTGDVAK
jgi:DNA-binding TFAR19-related protein (PDSD5 family)